MRFMQTLADAWQRHDSLVCVGLDPELGKLPAHLKGRPDAVFEFCAAIVDATADLACAFKPQIAHFAALRAEDTLERLIAHVHAKHPGVPVILDAKRGDIGSTSEAYARAYLGTGDFAADALTINAYLGLDTLEPYLDAAVRHGRGLFVVLKTSNPGSADLQDLRLASGELLHQALADRLTERAAALPADGAGYTALGAVVGATYPQALRELRARLPRSVLLVPGYGAQGGTAADVAAAFDGDGAGAVVSASRSLTYLDAHDETDLGRAARAAAGSMRDDLNRALAERT